jgi:hypothetical protein
MLCRCMTIRAQEHEAPYEGKLSLNWNRGAASNARSFWSYPKRGITDNLPSGSGKSRKGVIVVLWRAHDCVSMKSNDSRRACEVYGFCKSDRPMRPGANDKESRWIA